MSPVKVFKTQFCKIRLSLSKLKTVNKLKTPPNVGTLIQSTFELKQCTFMAK